ncbi:MAG: OmpH family outer membrane protein [Tepidisphaeraceae bacterium]
MTTSRFAVALTALFLAAAPAFAQTKVAIANPIKILNDLAETKDVNKAMEGEQATLKAQAGERDASLKKIQEQRDLLKSDSPQWADLNKQLVSQRAEATAWYQQAQLELQRKFREQAKRMHAKISAAVAEIAKAEGYDVVIAEQKPEVSDQQMEQMNPQQILGYLFGRPLLYNSDAVDLTQKTIAKLDAAYKAK